MEEEAPSANKHVTEKSDQEYLVMAIFPTAYNAFDSQVYEEEIGQGIDNLCRVWCCVVILEFVSLVNKARGRAVECTSSHQFKVDVTGSQ